MNERIKELADQVGLGTQHNGIVLTKNVDAAEAFEQFALLIVRECIAKYDEWAGESSDQTSFRMARHNVKKHFGVEP